MSRNRQLGLSFLAALYLWLLSAHPALGQPVDTVLVTGNPVAEFRRATSISIAADGRMFVVDADRNALVVLRLSGEVDEIIGGPGTDEGQFDGPADVDPTNGLAIYIADMGNGRIQKFSRAFRFLESLPVVSNPALSREDQNPSFRVGAGVTRQPSDGLPVSVITSRLDDLYVVESVSATVIRWDRDRRNSWVIGNEDAGEYELQAPVDLATNGEYLFVADSIQKAVMVYDLFGAPVRAIAKGRLVSIRAVKSRSGRILAILKDRIIEFTVTGRLLRTVRVQLPENLVDADYFDHRFFLLTERHLYRVLD